MGDYLIDNLDLNGVELPEFMKPQFPRKQFIEALADDYGLPTETIKKVFWENYPNIIGMHKHLYKLAFEQ